MGSRKTPKRKPGRTPKNRRAAATNTATKKTVKKTGSKKKSRSKKVQGAEVKKEADAFGEAVASQNVTPTKPDSDRSLWTAEQAGNAVGDSARVVKKGDAEFEELVKRDARQQNASIVLFCKTCKLSVGASAHYSWKVHVNSKTHRHSGPKRQDNLS